MNSQSSPPEIPSPDPEASSPLGGPLRARRSSVAIGVALIALWLVIAWLGTSTAAEPIPYSRFLQLVDDNNVTQVTISSGKIQGKYRSSDKTVGFASTQPPGIDNTKLVDRLNKHKVKVMGSQPGGWSSFLGVALSWVLPLALFIGVWLYLMRRMQGGTGGAMSFGRTRAAVVDRRDLHTTFNDVAGLDEAVAELREIVDFLRSPERYQKLGGRIPRGVLLVGPPGTGKTLLARAVAGEASVPFFSLTGSDFVELFVGVGAARVRDLFEQAKAKAPCIVFIDELDTIGRTRSAAMSGIGTHEEREQTLNQLLSEMDGFDTNSGVIIMSATNRPEILDPALLRPGRFDRQVVVDRPDRVGRAAILRIHARNVKLAPDADLDVIAARTPGFAGAELANVINEAALLAARYAKPAVGMQEIEEAIDRVSLGLERHSRVIGPHERERVAYHELGHAIVAASLPHADPVHRVSIIPRGSAALGVTQQLPAEDRYIITEPELNDRLAVAMGGRAAERLVFGDSSTGAHNDLQEATLLARRMVEEFGMSDAVGPVALARPEQFLSIEAIRPTPLSPEIANRVDAAIRELLDDAEQRASETLQGKHTKLDQLAKILLEKETLDGDDLREALTDKTTAVNARAADRPKSEPAL